MLTGLFVIVGAPIFTLVFVVRVFYGLYKDYKENQEFEEYLKRKYGSVYKGKWHYRW